MRTGNTPGTSDVSSILPTEPAQLLHERDELGFVPSSVAGRHLGSCGIAALHAGIVRDVRKRAYADYHTLTFALGGDTLFCRDPLRRLRVPIAAGTVTVQPADVESVWQSAGESRWLQFYLSTALVAECASHLGLSGDAALILERRPGVDTRDAVRVLYACALHMSSGTVSDALDFDAWAVTLARYLVTAYAPSVKRPSTAATDALAPRRLADAYEYISASLGPGLTASSVAAALGLSRFHFTRAFTAATGEAPYRYIQRERLRAARALVTGTTRSLADIACEVGYAHQGHMSAVFTRELGASPARVRALSRGRTTAGRDTARHADPS